MRDTTCATTSSMYVDVCVAAAELTDAPKRNSTTGVVGLGADRADEAPPVPEGGGKAFGSELLRLTDPMPWRSWEIVGVASVLLSG